MGKDKSTVNEYGLGVREDAVAEDGSFVPLHKGKEVGAADAEKVADRQARSAEADAKKDQKKK